MKTRIKKISIILLVLLVFAAILTSLAACAKKPSTDDNTNAGDNVGSTLDKVKIFNQIREGLINQGKIINAQTDGIRSDDSEFFIRAQGINIKITYKAMLDIEREEDSEILVKVDNLDTSTNAIFVYYHNKDLYIHTGRHVVAEDEIVTEENNFTNKLVLKSFSTHRLFPSFMEIVRSVDLKDFLFSDNIASKIGKLYDLVDSKNMYKIALDDNGTNSIQVKDVALDKYSNIVNDFIQDKLQVTGNKLDALTRNLLGFKLSDVQAFQVARLTMRNLEIIERPATPGGVGTHIDSIKILLNDKQSDNITEYSIGANYTTKLLKSNDRKAFTLSEVGPLSPYNIDYKTSETNGVHLSGKVNVYGNGTDALETWDLDIKGQFSADEDIELSKNKFSVDMRNKSENTGTSSYNIPMLQAWLRNGRIYLNLEGLLNRYIAQSIDYAKLNLPKIKFEDIDFSTQVNYLYSKLFSLINSSIDINDIFGSPNPGNEGAENKFKDALKFISSTDDVISLTINKEFIEMVFGSNKTISDVIGKALKLDENMIEAMKKTKIFDKLSAIFKYDLSKQVISVDMFNGTNKFANIFLNIYRTKEDFKIVYPDETDPSYFEFFEKIANPDVKNVDFELDLQHSNGNNLDISKFIGLFIGDITGGNSKYEIAPSDRFVIKGNLWQQDQKNSVIADVLIKKLDGTNVVLFKLCTDPTANENLLVEDMIHGIKFKLPLSSFKDQYRRLTNNETNLDYDGIVDIISRADEYARFYLNGDDITLEILSKLNSEDDIIHQYTGIAGLFGKLRFKAYFEAPNTSYFVPSEYVFAKVEFDSMQKSFPSLYDFEYEKEVKVTIGNNVYRYNASYIPNSIAYAPGKDTYNPAIELMGQKATYRIYVTNRVNGLKKVLRLKTASIEIDPSMTNPIPDKIGVIFEDGSLGELSYTIVDFPYNNSNILGAINGVPTTKYDLYLGYGKVHETKFAVNVTILSRAIKPLGGKMINDTPIVAVVEIDPVEYSLRKMDPTYNIFKYRESTVEGFEPHQLVVEWYIDVNNPNMGTNKQVVESPNWGFSADEINFSGLTKTVFGKINTIDIAMEVTVLNKAVSHIKINDDPNNAYTVDALIKATHTIPTKTSAENSVRIYFSSGHYRIIGDDPGTPIEDPLCDGYYPRPLTWSHQTADYADINGTFMPLANGRKNETTSVFGTSDIGQQTVTLRVVCPSRKPNFEQDPMQSIIRIEYYEGTETINADEVIYESIKYNKIAFNRTMEANGIFVFDPYSSDDSNIKLPQYIYMDVLFAGNTIKRAKYNVTWQVSRPGESLEGESLDSNIILSDGKIKNALSYESYLEANGVIGDYLKTNIKVVILNKSAEFDRIKFFNEDESVYRYINDSSPNGTLANEVVNEYGKASYSLLELNPYNQITLPAKARLVFPEGADIVDNIYSINWKTKENGLALNDYLKTHMTKDGGEVILEGSIGGGGIVSQKLELTLKFKKKIVLANEIFGIVSTLTPSSSSSSGSGDRYEVIDSYNAESAAILEMFEGSISHTIGVRFEDETVALAVSGEFSNAAALITALKSPYGTDVRINPALYPNGVIELKGQIMKGTSLEQNVSLRLKVDANIIAGINLPRVEDKYKIQEDGIRAFDFMQTHRRYSEEEGIHGDNKLTITFAKPYLIKKRIGEENLTIKLSEYLNYIFEYISISLGSRNLESSANITYVADFNDLAYHKIQRIDENVSYEDNGKIVVIKLKINKFGNGSCIDPYDLIIRVVKDDLVSRNVSEQLEVYDIHGQTLYGSTYGYMIPEKYSIKFAKSGIVEFSDLVWKADANADANNSAGELVARITKDSVVTNIPNAFFNFSADRTIYLKTTLPDGTVFNRSIQILSKYIDTVYYDINDAGIFNIKSEYGQKEKSGMLHILDVYKYYPINTIAERLPKFITPLRSQISGNPKVVFEINSPWIPAAGFASDSDPNVFDSGKLTAQINSSGLNRILFATSKIVGYNGQVQIVHMYIKVEKFDAGIVSHESLNLVNNIANFDPYANPDNTGEIILPRDITISYTNPDDIVITHKFANTDDVRYEIFNVNTSSYDPIEKITYNRFGHSLSADYGEPTASLRLRIVLPDGNNSSTILINCLNREIVSLKIQNKKTLENANSEYIESSYYIDPYDKSTFALPEYGYFSFGVSSGTVQDNVKTKISLFKAAEDDPFTVGANSRLIYTPRADSDSYKGGQYLVYGFLKGFGVNDARQFFFINVFILDRTLSTKPTYLSSASGTYSLEAHGKNPIEFLASDIPSKLNESGAEFASYSNASFSLDDKITALEESLSAITENTGATYNYRNTYESSIYQGYDAITKPVIPSIKWNIIVTGTQREITNNDIIPTGFDYSMIGNIGYGDNEEYIFSEKVDLSLIAKKWSYAHIIGVDDEETDPKIDFSPFTKTTVASSYQVVFKVDNEEQSPITFLPEHLLGSNPGSRAIIYFGAIGSIEEEQGKKHQLTLKNPIKTSVTNEIYTSEVFSYSLQQVPIEQISFGFGPNGGYGGTGEALIIIDPLNVVVPTKVHAKGRATSEDSPLIDIGEVGVEWEEGFWNYSNIPIDYSPTAYKNAGIKLRLTPDAPTFVPFTVKVYYINRVPNVLSTDDKPNMYKISGTPGADGFVSLMTKNADNSQIWNFRIDPTESQLIATNSTDSKINAKYYDELLAQSVTGVLTDSWYILPSRIKANFANPASGIIKDYGLPKFGSDVVLKDVKWLLSRDITLEGATETSFISAQIRSYRVEYKQTIDGVTTVKTSRLYNFDYGKADVEPLNKNYTLNLQVIEKKVRETSISTLQVVRPPGANRDYYLQIARSEYALDPYGIIFPNTVNVSYEDGNSDTFENVNWEYNTAYLNKHDVISGKIGEDFMNLYASFRVFGARLYVKFKIKPRNIDVIEVVGGVNTVVPLEGGLLYAVKGVPLKEQLPDHLYYKFDLGGGVEEISRVPLVFSEAAIQSVNMNIAQDYTDIMATLGKIEKNNIKFTVRVFDMKLAAVNKKQTANAVTYINSNYIYDEINIAVTRAGDYSASAELDKLPSKLMLTNDIYGGDYAEIFKIEYFDIRTNNAYAKVFAKYVFKAQDTNIRLFGSASEIGYDSDKQIITLKVPVKKYQFSNIEISEAAFSQNSVEVELGSKIYASQMPVIKINANRTLKPLWIMNDINTNKAGKYIAYCYFKNAYGDIVEGSIDVFVKRYKLVYEADDNGKKDVILSEAFLNRDYSGVELNIADYITISNMLREDGSIGQLNKYTVEYSIDRGANWQIQQPIKAIPADNIPYMVRISVTDYDDYNVTGYIRFDMYIRKLTIYGSDVRFAVNNVDVENEVEFTYDGTIKIPDIVGVHRDVQYIREYRKIVEGEEAPFSTTLQPINVGRYQLKIRFRENQENFIIREEASKTIYITINKPAISYSLVRTMVYNGMPRDVVVEGLPANLDGLNVTYTYFVEINNQFQQLPAGRKIKDAGRYRVSVSINGGANYPHANFAGNVTPELMDIEIEIVKKKIAININTVKSEYLARIKPYESSLSITDIDGTNPITGTEAINILKQNINHIVDSEGNIIRYILTTEAGKLTEKHTVGQYRIYFDSSIQLNLANYEIDRVEDGIYEIEARQATVISTKQELDGHISTLKDGDTVRWYLKSGSYGNIVLNKNASVTIVGCYDVTSAENKIAVSFMQIICNKGSLSISIVKFARLENNATLRIGQASSVTINNCLFEASMEGNIPVVKSTGIEADALFKGTIYISNTTMKNYQRAIVLYGGSLDMDSCNLRINSIAIDIHVADTNISIRNSILLNNEFGIKFNVSISRVSLQDNEFLSNIVAIEKGQVALRNDTIYQNFFSNNHNNIV